MNNVSNYLRNISKRDQDWADIGKRTVYIEPRRLTSSDWDIIECGRDFDTISDLARAMPMDIGGLRKKPRDTIYKWAQSQTKTYSAGNYGGGHDFVRQTVRQYGDDVEIMRGALWEGEFISSDGQIGHFNKQRADYVHPDNDTVWGMVFASRVGEAPFDTIPGNLILTDDQKKLVERAEEHTPPPDDKAIFPEAVVALRQQKILRPTQVDRVIMLFTSPSYNSIGTKHVSGPLPPEGADSGFLRTFTKFDFI